MSHKYQRLIMYISLLFILFFLILGLSTRKYVFSGHDYYNRDKVALYLYKYAELPPNFLTKDEALNSYESYNMAIKKGYNIGGDKFLGEKNPDYVDWIGNYVDDLNNLYECDIYKKRNEIIEKNNRGSERLIYSIENDFVYYTDNHYGENETPGFVLLEEYALNKTSNNCFFILGIGLIVIIILNILLITNKENRKLFGNDLKDVIIKTFLGIGAMCLLPFYGILFLAKLVGNKISDIINEHSD